MERNPGNKGYVFIVDNSILRDGRLKVGLKVATTLSLSSSPRLIQDYDCACVHMYICVRARIRAYVRASPTGSFFYNIILSLLCMYSEKVLSLCNISIGGAVLATIELDKRVSVEISSN